MKNYREIEAFFDNLWEEQNNIEKMDRLGITILDKRMTHPKFPSQATAVIFECSGVRYGYVNESNSSYYDCGLPDNIKTIKEWGRKWIKESGREFCPNILK